MAARKDGKGRALRAGEQYRKSEGRGRYSYCYTDPFGKRKYIYSTNLAKLREREDMLIKNQMDGYLIYVLSDTKTTCILLCSVQVNLEIAYFIIYTRKKASVFLPMLSPNYILFSNNL